MTPLPDPAYYLASNGRLMKAAGDVDCTGKKFEIYTTDELCAYGAAEYKRGAAELQAMSAERDALRADVHALLHQIDIGDFVDRHGHSAKMLSAVHDLLGRKA